VPQRLLLQFLCTLYKIHVLPARREVILTQQQNAMLLIIRLLHRGRQLFDAFVLFLSRKTFQTPFPRKFDLAASFRTHYRDSGVQFL
jgi:hypothetical protein